jgi:hypothetical protein
VVEDVGGRGQDDVAPTVVKLAVLLEGAGGAASVGGEDADLGELQLRSGSHRVDPHSIARPGAEDGAAHGARRLERSLDGLPDGEFTASEGIVPTLEVEGVLAGRLLEEPVLYDERVASGNLEDVVLDVSTSPAPSMAQATVWP